MPLVNKFFNERKTIFLQEIESPYLALQNLYFRGVIGLTLFY